MDVAGEREQPGLRDHLDGLLSHSPGRRFQIQRAEYRDDKDVVLAAGPWVTRVLHTEAGSRSRRAATLAPSTAPLGWA